MKYKIKGKHNWRLIPVAEKLFKIRCFSDRLLLTYVSRLEPSLLGFFSPVIYLADTSASLLAGDLIGISKAKDSPFALL